MEEGNSEFFQQRDGSSSSVFFPLGDVQVSSILEARSVWVLFFLQQKGSVV